jgi:hypothetical protein
MNYICPQCKSLSKRQVKCMDCGLLRDPMIHMYHLSKDEARELLYEFDHAYITSPQVLNLVSRLQLFVK